MKRVFLRGEETIMKRFAVTGMLLACVIPGFAQPIEPNAGKWKTWEPLGHGRPVADTVWDLYRRTVARRCLAPTLVEWDNNVPAFAVPFGGVRSRGRW